MWQRLLITIPAAIVDLWLHAYLFVIIAASFMTWGVLTAALLLALFGERWGW